MSSQIPPMPHNFSPAAHGMGGADPEVAWTTLHVNGMASRVQNTTADHWPKRERFLWTNFLSQFWTTRAVIEDPKRIGTLSVFYVLGMAGYLIALPIRIALFVMEFLGCLVTAFNTLFTWEWGKLGINLAFTARNFAECGSAVVGVVCPPLAYFLDEQIEDFEIIRNNTLIPFWSDGNFSFGEQVENAWENIGRLFAKTEFTPEEIQELVDGLAQTAQKEEKIILGHLLENRNQLGMWLNRLKAVGDYGADQNRIGIAKLIYNAMQQAEEDEEFRATFLACIEDADRTCGDRMALSILKVGIQYRIATSKRDLKDLAFVLGHGAMALDKLEQFAREKIDEFKRQNRSVDPIEVYLAFPVKLKEALNLPIEISTMLFFRCSSLSERDIEAAKNFVLPFLQDLEGYCRFLDQQDTWQNALKTHRKTKGEYGKILSARNNAALEDDPDWVQIDKDYKDALFNLTKRLVEPDFPFLPR